MKDTDCPSPQHNSHCKCKAIDTNYVSGCCAQCDQDILDEEEQ